jgi:hypothetical protein
MDFIRNRFYPRKDTQTRPYQARAKLGILAPGGGAGRPRNNEWKRPDNMEAQFERGESRARGKAPTGRLEFRETDFAACG